MSGTASDTTTEATVGAGVRVDLEIPDPPGCPVAAASADAGAEVGSVRWTAGAGGDVVTEQFTVADADPATDATVDADPVFDHDGGRVYEVTREGDGECVCQRIEELSVPVADVRAVDGSLRLTLHLRDVDHLREVMADLRDRYGEVTVRSLARTGDGLAGGDPALVDRSRLTDRQREALLTAYEMGYFEYPREANASEVAEAMGIGPSTLIEHLTAAQRKVLDDLLGGDADRR